MKEGDRQNTLIYSQESELPRELRVPTVELKGVVAKEAVIRMMRSFDAVLIPMDASPAQRHLTGFNISTKMAECLASGTLTIAFGPTYAAMVQYLQTSGAACVLTDELLPEWPAVAASEEHSLQKKDARHCLRPRVPWYPPT